MKQAKPDFHAYYRTIYGDRWTKLAEGLADEPHYHTLRNGVRIPYHLDQASYAAAVELAVEPGDRVLDMCAAPGGKALVLATKLEGRGLLVANDRSSARRARLTRVINELLEPQYAGVITVTGHDATRWGLYETNSYDKVLADVPCSSERHVISSDKHMARWSPSRTKRLALQAYAILAAGLDAADVEGIVLYVTCSLSPMENDGVLEKLMRRRGADVSILPVRTEMGTATQYGKHILPDIDNGSGPLYMARLQKVRASAPRRNR